MAGFPFGPFAQWSYRTLGAGSVLPFTLTNSGRFRLRPTPHRGDASLVFLSTAFWSRIQKPDGFAGLPVFSVRFRAFPATSAMNRFLLHTISVLKHRFKTEDAYRVRKSAHVRICSLMRFRTACGLLKHTHQRWACFKTESVSGSHSHSIVATGFSLMSQRTRFTPGTVWTIRSRMRQRTEKGISGTVALTASTVLTARTTTAQPM